MAFNITDYLDPILGIQPNNEYSPGVNAPSNYGGQPPVQAMTPAVRPNYPPMLPPPMRANMLATGPLPGEDASTSPMTAVPRPNFPVTPPPSPGRGFPFMRPYPGDEPVDAFGSIPPPRFPMPPNMPATAGVPNLQPQNGMYNNAPAPNAGFGPAPMPPPQPFPNRPSPQQAMPVPPGGRMPVDLPPPPSVGGGGYPGGPRGPGGPGGPGSNFLNSDGYSRFTDALGGLSQIKSGGKFGSLARGFGLGIEEAVKSRRGDEAESDKRINRDLQWQLLQAKMPGLQADANAKNALADYRDTLRQGGGAGLSSSFKNNPRYLQLQIDNRLGRQYNKELEILKGNAQFMSTEALSQEKEKLDKRFDGLREKVYKENSIPDRASWGEGTRDKPWEADKMGAQTPADLKAHGAQPGEVYRYKGNLYTIPEPKEQPQPQQPTPYIQSSLPQTDTADIERQLGQG